MSYRQRQQLDEAFESMFGSSQKRSLLEDHDRCPRGKHWNDNDNKCAKVDIGIRMKQDDAKGASKAAADASTHANDPGLPGKTGGYAHGNAAGSHAHAKHAHQFAAKQLSKAGFSKAAAEHEKAAKDHETAELAHGSKADPDHLAKLKANNPFMAK